MKSRGFMARAGSDPHPRQILRAACDAPGGPLSFPRRGRQRRTNGQRSPENEIAVKAQHILIRDETKADLAAITDVTVAAFETLDISSHTEQFVIEALRAAHALTVSLVADMDGRVVGHIAFSPVTMSDGTPDWYGLGPVSVLPAYQCSGIGTALIHEGLSRLKQLGARGCCLVGHPQYYRKFGFENVAGLVHQGVPREVFFALSFDGRYPQGEVGFHEGFGAHAASRQ